MINRYGSDAHIFGRYCSIMRLKAYQVFGFDDSNELNALKGDSNYIIKDFRLLIREESNI